MSGRADLMTRETRPSLTDLVSAIVEEYVHYLSQIVTSATPQDVIVWILMVVPTMVTLVFLSRPQKPRVLDTGSEGLYSSRAFSGSQSSTPTNRMQRDLDIFNSDIFFNSPDDPNATTAWSRRSSAAPGKEGDKWAVKTAGSTGSPEASVPLLREHVERNQRVQPLHDFTSPARSAVSDVTLPSPFQVSTEHTSHVPSDHMAKGFFAHMDSSGISGSNGSDRFFLRKLDSEMVESQVRGKLALKQFVHSFYRTIGGNGIRVQLLRKGKLIYRFLKLDRDKECLYWNTGTRWPRLLGGKRREWPVKNIKSVAKGMRVYIESLNSKVFMIEAEPSELVNHVKMRVADKEALNANDIELAFESKILLPDRSLVSYGIENGATVFVVKVTNTSKKSLLQNVDRMVKNQLLKTGPFGFELVLQNPDAHHKLKVYMLYVERESERDFFVRNFNYLIQNLELASTVMRSLNPVAAASSSNISNSVGGAAIGVSGGGDVGNEMWMEDPVSQSARRSNDTIVPDDVSIAESDNSYSTLASADMRHLGYNHSNKNAKTAFGNSESAISSNVSFTGILPPKPRPPSAGDVPDNDRARSGLDGLARRSVPMRGSLSGNTNTMKSKLSIL